MADEQGWNTGSADMDAALEALENLQGPLFEVVAHLKGDQPAHGLLGRLGEKLPVADDILWGEGADGLNYDVAVLDRMLAVQPLEPGGRLTAEMVDELTNAAKEATVALQAYQGEVP